MCDIVNVTTLAYAVEIQRKEQLPPEVQMGRFVGKKILFELCGYVCNIYRLAEKTDSKPYPALHQPSFSLEKGECAGD